MKKNRIAFYSIFDDETLVTIAGMPQICSHCAAILSEDAIDPGHFHVRKVGFDVVHVEIGSQGV